MPPAEMPRLARRQSSVGKRRANESVPNVSVGLGQGVGLKRGRAGCMQEERTPWPTLCARAEEGDRPRERSLVLADCNEFEVDDALATLLEQPDVHQVLGRERLGG